MDRPILCRKQNSFLVNASIMLLSPPCLLIAKKLFRAATSAASSGQMPLDFTFLRKLAGLLAVNFQSNNPQCTQMLFQPAKFLSIDPRPLSLWPYHTPAFPIPTPA